MAHTVRPMAMTNKKFVTDEYHEGQVAYWNGQALTTNPYIQPSGAQRATKNTGGLWYWMFGWQDAMAEDVRRVKQVLLTIAQPVNGETN